MRKSKLLFIMSGLLSLLWFSQKLSAQDVIPRLPEMETKKIPLYPLKEIRTGDSICAHIPIPKPFTGMTSNYIMDEHMTLDPVLERLRLLRIGSGSDTLHIVHVGDSHVRGHIFPQTTGDRLKADFGEGIKYTDMGVNGATCLTFTHPDRIAGIVSLKPDLVILSFGTNESHNRRYNENIHYSQMDELIKLLQSRLPDTPLLLTTPPGSYDSFRQRRRKRTYSINPRTALATENIIRYARNNKLAVWDLYSAVGGKSRACKNWTESGLMRPDHVHYLPEGYVLQGELLYEAIIKSYNTYVSF